MSQESKVSRTVVMAFVPMPREKIDKRKLWSKSLANNRSERKSNT